MTSCHLPAGQPERLATSREALHADDWADDIVRAALL